MKILSLMLLVFIGLTYIPAEGKMERNYLDNFCQRAEYVVVAECVERTDGTAKLKVEKIFKAPKENPKPIFLDVKGEARGEDIPFAYQKSRRYVAFIFRDKFCTSWCIEITKDNKLVQGYGLICLEEKTDTLEKLSKQIELILSGQYEKQLVDKTNNKELAYHARREHALALVRTNPETAIGVLHDFLLEISKQPNVDGSNREVYMSLLALNPDRTRDLSLQILSNTETFTLYFEAAETLANPQCKLPDLKKHYEMLVNVAEKWERNNPHSGYVHMLRVFVNNNCQGPEVKKMLLAELSSSKIDYFDLISESAIELQIPESLPLFWGQIKKQRLESDLVNLDYFIARRVGASSVFESENFERLEVWMGENLIREKFPQFISSVKGAEVVKINKSLLFLIKPEVGNPVWIYVGYLRNAENKIDRKAFMLFGN